MQINENSKERQPSSMNKQYKSMKIDEQSKVRQPKPINKQWKSISGGIHNGPQMAKTLSEKISKVVKIIFLEGPFFDETWIAKT